VQVKLWYPLTMCAIPECLRDVSCIGVIQIDITFTFKMQLQILTKKKITKYNKYIIEVTC